MESAALCTQSLVVSYVYILLLTKVGLVGGA